MIGPEDDDEPTSTGPTKEPEPAEEEAEEEAATTTTEGDLEGGKDAELAGHLEMDAAVENDQGQLWDEGFFTDVGEDLRASEGGKFEAGEHYSSRSMLQSILPVGKFPEIAYNFIVSVGADIMGDFQSVEGIGYRIEPFSYNEGGRNHSPHMMPFRSPGEPQVATLRWGTVVWSTLYDWIKAVEVGKNYRRSVWVIQLSREGWPSRITRLGSAWPVEWSAARLSTQSSEWALEELKIAYEEINMVLTRAGDLG